MAATDVTDNRAPDAGGATDSRDAREMFEAALDVLEEAAEAKERAWEAREAERQAREDVTRLPRLASLRPLAEAELAELDARPRMFTRTVAAVTGTRVVETAGERLDRRTGRMMRELAVKNAEWCAICGIDLGPDATVWIGKLYTAYNMIRVPTCGVCADDRLRWRPLRCEGCNRPLRDWRDWIEHPVCSDRCRTVAANDRRRVAHETRKCEQCGEPFEPKRDDARFCGATCRQRGPPRVTGNREWRARDRCR